MFNTIRKRVVSVATICALVMGGVHITQNEVMAADEETKEIVDTSDWTKSVSIDFGVTNDLDEEGNAVPSLMQTDQSHIRQALGDVKTATPIEGRGYWLYSDTTVQDVYGTAAATKQKMGFDKVMPAGVTETGGNCFKDWVYSPDGEEYSFSIDLPVGQYYMAVYTGNKTAQYDNTTCVRFNDESFMMEDTEVPVVYDQTSKGGEQFYGDNRKEFVYVVDVKDNGQGYGTLKATFFDDTDHENSHKITVGDAKEHGVKVLDFYEGTENEISKDDISNKLITARLNGFEIIPLENPNHIGFNADKEIEEYEYYYPTGKRIRLGNGNSTVTDRLYYVSSDPTVAEISVYGGWVNLLKLGTATIYIYDAYFDEVVAKRNVTCNAEDTLTLDKTELNLVLGTNGSEWRSTLTASYYRAYNDIIEWKASKNGIVVFSEVLNSSDSEFDKSWVAVGGIKEGQVTVTVTVRRHDGTRMSAECLVNVTRAENAPTPTPTAAPTPIPTPTPAPAVTPVPTNHCCTYKIRVDGKKTMVTKPKKTVTFNVKALGTKVKKVKCVIKSGKKLATVKTTKSKVKIKAKKRGKLKLVINVTATNGRIFKYKRTIKIK